jgi:CRISPR-associated protein Csd1
MLLTALKAFSDANNETGLPDFYDLQEVGYRVDLDRDGNLLSFVAMNDPANPKRGLRLPIPYIKRTSSIVPLVIDKGDYLLGVTPTKKEDDERAKAAIRTPKAHRAYLDLLAEAVAATHAEPLRALERFARSFVAVDNDPRLPDGFDAAGFVAVYVDGLLVSEDSRVQKWWADRQTASGANRASPHGDASAAGYDEICGVCGRPGASVEVIPIGIRGFGSLGGSATMALISGNDDAFVRHGMPRASGAGVCIDCGRATHQALNRLIGDPKHCKRLGTTLTVWWATEECEDLLAAVLEGHTDGAVGEVLSSITSGRLRRPVDASRFYGVSLGASKSRIVIRSWIDTTLGEAQDHICSWFQRLRVVDKWDGSIAAPPGLFRLLASLAPPGQGDALSRIDPSLPISLLETALAGRALPWSVLAQVLGRIRAEQGAVTPLRAALLKACLVSPDHPNLEEHMTGLDLDNNDPPYLCGRLLAMLDQASRLATSANNALVDRSYASASTMPAVTFTRLLRLHRSHLDKLKRDNPGAAFRIDRTVTEIMNGFGGTSGLPAHLGMAEQGRFALGLYHQEAASRASAQAAKAARAVSGQPSDRELEPTINENEE